MSWTFTVLLVVQILSSLSIISLVLLQQGKGADMGSAFGSGSAGSLFGATGAANFLSRATKWAAVVFFISTIGLAYISNRGAKGQDTGIMSNFTQTAPVPAPAGSAVPGLVPAVPNVTPGAAVPASSAPASIPAAAPAAVPAAPALVAPVPAVPASQAVPAAK
ncbi:MAG: preprotein translocase subunit SecG [Gallionella sp.]|nr:preprotein translocase subunit SecG [Gallionella sp.]